MRQSIQEKKQQSCDNNGWKRWERGYPFQKNASLQCITIMNRRKTKKSWIGVFNKKMDQL